MIIKGNRESEVNLCQLSNFTDATSDLFVQHYSKKWLKSC